MSDLVSAPFSSDLGWAAFDAWELEVLAPKIAGRGEIFISSRRRATLFFFGEVLGDSEGVGLLDLTAVLLGLGEASDEVEGEGDSAVEAISWLSSELFWVIFMVTSLLQETLDTSAPLEL